MAKKNMQLQWQAGQHIYTGNRADALRAHGPLPDQKDYVLRQ